MRPSLTLISLEFFDVFEPVQNPLCLYQLCVPRAEGSIGVNEQGKRALISYSSRKPFRLHGESALRNHSMMSKRYESTVDSKIEGMKFSERQS